VKKAPNAPTATRLRLDRETLYRLEAATLAAVSGGVAPVSIETTTTSDHCMP